jgi:poly-gamma-glutamate capsule biosynthesis protein CapA/YwtB (metallophosphatase superfamily)
MRIASRRITVTITLLTAAFVLLPTAGLTQQTAWPWADGGGDGVTLLLFGDTNIQERQHPGDAFKNLLPTLRSADVRFANCEMLFVEPSDDPLNPDLPHKLTWRHSHPSQVKGLAAAGFDAVGLASNVAYPVGALLKTLPVLQQAGIPFTGSGRNLAEARRPVIIERKGVKIGFQQWTSIFWHIGHAATETTPGVSTVKIHTSYQPHRRINEMPGGAPTVITIPDAEELARFTSDIRALRQKVDIVVASLQYGISSSTEVADYQRTLARAAIDAGADIVIGHGPHMLQPVEVYKGKPVFLSLGNFVFDWPKMREKQDGLMARAVIRDRKLAGVSFVPLRRDAGNNPVLLDPNAGAGAEMLKQLRELGGAGGAELTVRGKEVIVGGVGAELSRAAGR